MIINILFFLTLCTKFHNLFYIEILNVLNTYIFKFFTKISLKTYLLLIKQFSRVFSYPSNNYLVDYLNILNTVIVILEMRIVVEIKNITNI